MAPCSLRQSTGCTRIMPPSSAWAPPSLPERRSACRSPVVNSGRAVGDFIGGRLQDPLQGAPAFRRHTAFSTRMRWPPTPVLVSTTRTALPPTISAASLAAAKVPERLDDRQKQTASSPSNTILSKMAANTRSWAWEVLAPAKRVGSIISSR